MLPRHDPSQYRADCGWRPPSMPALPRDDGDDAGWPVALARGPDAGRSGRLAVRWALRTEAVGRGLFRVSARGFLHDKRAVGCFRATMGGGLNGGYVGSNERQGRPPGLSLVGPGAPPPPPGGMIGRPGLTGEMVAATVAAAGVWYPAATPVAPAPVSPRGRPWPGLSMRLGRALRGKGA